MEENRLLKERLEEVTAEDSQNRLRRELDETKAALRKAIEDMTELRARLAQADVKVREQQEALRAKDHRLAQLRDKWKELHSVFDVDPVAK
jgi:predicted nuclease with TOPRIM domain